MPAIRSPASAGPNVTCRPAETPLRAAAEGSCLAGTSLGKIAKRAAPTMVELTELSVASAYNGGSAPLPIHASAAMPPAATHETMAATMSAMRRSKASTRLLPKMPTTTIGANAMIPTSETAKVELVRS